MRKVISPYTGGFPLALVQWTAMMLDGSQATALKIGCSPQAIVAQAALETGWGKAAIGNNVFGIKAGAGWTGKTQSVTTREWNEHEGYYTIQDEFRDYDTVAAGIEDHFEFLLKNTRYADVFDPDDSLSDDEYFQHLQADGYATAPDYAYQLSAVLASVRNVEKFIVDDVCREQGQLAV